MRKSLCARAVIRSLSSDSDIISGSKEYRALAGDPCASSLLICEKATMIMLLALSRRDGEKVPSHLTFHLTFVESSYFLIRDNYSRLIFACNFFSPRNNEAFLYMDDSLIK